MEARDEDRYFARLEELVAELPEMQEKDRCLMRAREARELRDLVKKAQMLEEEIARYEQIKEQALRDAKAAKDCDDIEAEGESIARLQMYGEVHMTRLASMQRAQNTLKETLKESTLNLNDPLEEYALSDDEYQTLEKSVKDFQMEYMAVYQACQEAELRSQASE